MTREQFRGKTFFFSVLVACVTFVIPGALGQSTVPVVPPFWDIPAPVQPVPGVSFQEAAPRGFGDFNNSWAQAMIWWHNNLYVGTTRDSTCTSEYATWQFIALNLGVQFADTYYPYPPADPDLTCAPGLLLPLQAEIWRWSPSAGPWTMVYQSPAVIPNPGPGYGQPAPVGAPLLPYEIAFRDFAQVTEPDGTDALYAFSVNSGIVWDQTKIPPPRILRTTDGVHWAPLPQDAGTFLATLPFSTDHTSFRVGVTYKGKLFAICGPVEGEGSVIASANPAQGDNAWFTALPPSMQFYDMAVFNGWLYLGGFDSIGTVYQVYKTNAEGPPPYKLITVVPQGGYLTNPFPSDSVVSMLVRNKRLYVGTATFTEVLRINADDTWDLVVGIPRQVPNSAGELQWKYPTSNLGAGFGLTLNDHAWQMDDDFGHLYIGTYNASTASRLEPNGSLLLPYMGAQLYITGSDWYFNPVTTNGFGSTSPISDNAYLHSLDPHGGIFDYGFRTMSKTPYGFFVGTANDYFGLAIFESEASSSSALNPPAFLEVEPTESAGALLSWQATPSATSYQIYRGELLPIEIRQNPNFENSHEGTGTYFPDVYVAPYSLLGTTTSLSWLDSTVVSGHNYLYYIVATDQTGNTSHPSNLMTFPVLLPPVTFADIVSEVDILGQRGRFSPAINEQALLWQISAAQAYAAQCQINAAINALSPSAASSLLESPDSTDMSILIYKLQRRLHLYTEYPSQVITTEFCTQSSIIQ